MRKNDWTFAENAFIALNNFIITEDVVKTLYERSKNEIVKHAEELMKGYPQNLYTAVFYDQPNLPLTAKSRQNAWYAINKIKDRRIREDIIMYFMHGKTLNEIKNAHRDRNYPAKASIEFGMYILRTPEVSKILRTPAKKRRKIDVNSDIDDLKLCTRCRNLLKEYTIYTVGDLVSMTRVEITNIPHIGKGYADHIELGLHRVGLKLETDRSDNSLRAPKAKEDTRHEEPIYRVEEAKYQFPDTPSMSDIMAFEYPRNLYSIVFFNNPSIIVPEDASDNIDTILSTIGNDHISRVIIMHFKEGMKFKDISEILGITEEDARNIMKQGIRLFRQYKDILKHSL